MGANRTHGVDTDGSTLILGAGPAGLLAAYACEQLGASVAIMSRPERNWDGTPAKSALPGAQYLHEQIPGLTGEPDGVVKTILKGTAEGYAYKVYGDPAVQTSWSNHHPETPVWNLRKIYNHLWDYYQDRIIPTEITWEDLDDCGKRFPLVISTLPLIHACWKKGARALPDKEHEFKWAKFEVVDWVPEYVENNTVIYSGDPTDIYCRTSRVFGHGATEFGRGSPLSGGALLYAAKADPTARVAIPTARVAIPTTGIKVIATNCDCWPSIKRAGRFGTWERGYLTHQAYADAMKHYTEAFGAA